MVTSPFAPGRARCIRRTTKRGALSVVVTPFFLLVGAIVATMAPSPARATYQSEERIPTNHPIYRDIERIALTYGHIPRFLATRPLRLVELRSYIRAVMTEFPESHEDPAVARVRRLIELTAPGAVKPFITFKGDSNRAITISPYVHFIYEEDPRLDPELNRDYRLGTQIVAQVDSGTIFVFNGYAGTSSQGGRGTPNFGIANAWIEGVDFNSWMEEAYGEFEVSRLRLLLGHTWLRWGPGRVGTLSLSDAAPALDLVRGEVTFGGSRRAQWFISVLDPGPQTYVAGHRLEWAFGSSMSLGMTEMARFNGTSQALLYFIPVVPFSFWEKRPKTTPDDAVPGDTTGVSFSKNNVLWSIDLSWFVRRGYRLWGEFMIDDISFSKDYKPDMIAWQAGAEERWTFGSIDRPRMLTASIEYTRVNNFVYTAWHGHDFALQGFPLGFLYGPDLVLFSGELNYEHGSALELRVRGEVFRKGEGSLDDPWFPEDGKVDAGRLAGVTERDARLSASVIWWPSRLLRLEGTVGNAWLKNRDHLNVGEETETPFRLSARLEW